MPYLTGVVNSFADLRTALIAGLVANGWTQTGDIVHKGDIHFTALARETFAAVLDTEGLRFKIGVGISGGALVDASPAEPRLGRGRSLDPAITWPAQYHLHVGAGPDEFFLLLNYNVDFWTWAAMGVSATPDLGGTGVWFAAANNLRENDLLSSPGGQYRITPTSGGATWTGYAVPSAPGAPFWNTIGLAVAAGENSLLAEGIHCNLDGRASSWADNRLASSKIVGGPWYADPMLSRLPSAWNSETALLPIQVYVSRPESKVSLVLDVAHARYTRIDNYDPGEVIDIGPDRWKVYPFIRKNTAQRNANPTPETGNHSGTLGWAIRYDGA